MYAEEPETQGRRRILRGDYGYVEVVDDSDRDASRTFSVADILDAGNSRPATFPAPKRASRVRRGDYGYVYLVEEDTDE